jgi:hypothetical protein
MQEEEDSSIVIQASLVLSFFLAQPSHPFGPSCILLPFFCPLFVYDDDNEEKRIRRRVREDDIAPKSSFCK